MTKFSISEHFLGGSCIEIDEARFETVKRAREIIIILWDIEDTFSLLANSFVEFEEFLLTASVQYEYGCDMQHDAERFFREVRATINLKLITMLTASRVYEDQTRRRISQLTDLVKVEIDLNPIFSTAYDSSLEYRVMCALRNHALHHKLPLSTYGFNSSNLTETGSLSDNAPTRHRVTIAPKISVEDIANSDKFKKTTQKEVSELGFDYLDLKFFMRGFIEKLTRCHEEIREVTNTYFDGGLEILLQANEELGKHKGEEPKHVCLGIQHQGQTADSFHISYSRFFQLSEIRKNWTRLKHVQRSYVSSEVKIGKNTYPQEHPEIWIAS